MTVAHPPYTVGIIQDAATDDIKLTVDDKVKAPNKKWTFQAKVNGADRDLDIRLIGPTLSGFKIITPADKDEAEISAGGTGFGVRTLLELLRTYKKP